MENLPPDNPRIADYETAIGPNVEYYLPRFEEFEAGGSQLSWHWPAFFATTPWFLYRKMWLVGVLNLVYPFVLTFFCSIAFAFLIGSRQANPVIFGVLFLVLLAAPWFVLPMFANALYWRHIRNLVDRMPRAFAQNPEKKLARLERDGGTGLAVMLAVCAGMAFFCIFIIGILAAIAIPAYQDYTIRAQVTEGLNLATPVKAQVAEYWESNRRWPEQADLDLAAPIGKYVSSVGVASGSVVITYGKGANPVLNGKRIALLPGADAQGEIRWSCGNASHPAGVTPADGPSGSDLLDRYLPSACRVGTAR
ncbi:MAG: pilin [Pseudomonadota bacterium]